MKTYIAGNHEIPEIKEDIQQVSGYLWNKGWAESNAGNISYNVTHILTDIIDSFDFNPAVDLKTPLPALDKNIIIVTGTGTRMRDVWADSYKNTCIIQIINEGQSWRQAQKPELEKQILPTSELPTHLAIHNMLIKDHRKEKVIVHTHPDNLIALTHIREFCNQERINNMLWSIQPETCAFVYDGVGFIPYLQTGSEELANATIKKFKNHRVALWEKHGCLAIGKTAHEAFDLIDIVDKSAGIFFKCKNAGYEAEGISKKDLDELRDTFGIKIS